MYINQKKMIMYTILAIAVLAGLVGTATYAYFASTVTVGNNLFVNATTAAGSYSFTSYAQGSISLNVTSQDMLNTAVNTTVAKKSAAANLITSVTAPAGSSVTCSYDVIWAWNGGDYYTSAGLTLGTNKQYSVTVSGAAALAETDLSTLTWSANSNTGQATLIAKANASVTSSNSSGTTVKTTTATYTITAKIYNLNADQTAIKNKNFKARVTTSNTTCTMS